MKEYDEDQAVRAMIEAAGVPETDETYDGVCQVLDLIYDFYDENGGLEINFDDDLEEDEEDVDAIVAYVCRHLAKNGETEFTEVQIRAMVEAELKYEEECA